MPVAALGLLDLGVEAGIGERDGGLVGQQLEQLRILLAEGVRAPSPATVMRARAADPARCSGADIIEWICCASMRASPGIVRERLVGEVVAGPAHAALGGGHARDAGAERHRRRRRARAGSAPRRSAARAGRPRSPRRLICARSARRRRAASATARSRTVCGSWSAAICAAISASARWASTRSRSCSYRREFVIATAACPANSWTSSKSASVKRPRSRRMRLMFMAPMTSSPETSGTMMIASSSTGVPGIWMSRGSSRASLSSTGSRCSMVHHVSPCRFGIGKSSTASAFRRGRGSGRSDSLGVVDAVDARGCRTTPRSSGRRR